MVLSAGADPRTRSGPRVASRLWRAAPRRVPAWGNSAWASNCIGQRGISGYVASGMAMRTEVRVGIFVLFGLSMVGLVVFMIGDARHVFETKQTYHTSFADVQGLTRGSSVQMGGVTIGRITDVKYGEDPTSDAIRVDMSITTDAAVRIREDSVVTIEPKGMLGDKLVAITVGHPEAPQIPPGSTIPSTEGSGLMVQLSKMGEKASEVVGNLEKTTGTLAGEEFRDDMSASIKAIRNVVESMDQGDGYVPRLLHDRAEAEKLSNAISGLERATRRLEHLLAETNKAVAQVNNGPGFAHELLYGDQGTEAVAQVGNAAEQIALTLRGIREGDGLAHQLLYGGENSDSEKVIADLSAITGDLRFLVRQVREGKGTLGALMVDPSVYEDLKVLLGNVQRNEVLRALVRYSIKQDERTPRVQVRDPEPASAARK
jgi:phospholipid/cholesterol/gamma-HCH transport system substrate-binding protein